MAYETIIKFSADTAEGKAKIQDFSNAVSSAAGNITAAQDKLAGVTDKATGATVRNWREGNRLSGGMQSMAFSMTGASGVGMQLFNMMDSVGDSIERTRLKGGSFGDVLKMLKGDIGMMASAGVVGLAIAGFTALQKSIKDTNDLTAKLESRFLKLESTLLENKLARLKREYDSGKISIDEYREAWAKLTIAIETAEAAKEIKEYSEQLGGLAKKTIMLSAIATGGGGIGEAIAAIFSIGDDTKKEKIEENIRTIKQALALKIDGIISQFNYDLGKSAQKADDIADAISKQALKLPETDGLYTSGIDAEMAALQEKEAAKQAIYGETANYQLQLLDAQYTNYQNVLGKSTDLDNWYHNKKKALQLKGLEDFVKNNVVANKIHQAHSVFMAGLDKSLFDYKMSIGKALVASGKAAVGAMVADYLKAKAKEWALEGAANIAKGIATGNPAAIAGGLGMLAQAAAAGVAASYISSKTAIQNPQQEPKFAVTTNSYSPTAEGGSYAASGAGGGAGGERVAQTSNTIHLTAVQNIYGNVIGIDSLKDLWQAWNYENVRLVAADLGG